VAEKELTSRHGLWKALLDFLDKSHAWTEDPVLDEGSSEPALAIEAIRADMEDFSSRAYKMVSGAGCLLPVQLLLSWQGGALSGASLSTVVLTHAAMDLFGWNSQFHLECQR
jgi:hypothetical protein